ncbi:MAG: methyltransferase domain-containing protein [Rubripirellula sp.]
MSAQDRTLDQYQQFMRINAAANLFRSAREVGLLRELREGQRTLEQLCEALSLKPEATRLMMDALVATSIIEKYGDDFALSRVAHLLCEYDEDLGDQSWQRLPAQLRGEAPPIDDQSYLDSVAATQWIHTPSAMQAAEILDLGGEDELQGPSILDLGCGSAVWSSAMAHRDPKAVVTAVDSEAALKAAKSTADSIGLGDRFQVIEADSGQVELAEAAYDMVVLAQRLSRLSSDAGRELLTRAISAAKPGGRLIVIDLFRGPTTPNISECIEALMLELNTTDGSIRTMQEIQDELQELGLEQVQFTFLADSRVNMGMAVGTRPLDSV